MIVTRLPASGNSAKFSVTTVKKESFVIAMSFTLRTKIWKLADEPAELTAAQELAEAIVSRHDPTMPFKPLYILAEHNAKPSLVDTVKQIRTLSA